MPANMVIPPGRPIAVEIDRADQWVMRSYFVDSGLDFLPQTVYPSFLNFNFENKIVKLALDNLGEDNNLNVN